MEDAVGVVMCRTCSLSPGGIIEKTLGAKTLELEPIAEQALRMTSNMLAFISVTQSWKSWIQPNNLDAYTGFLTMPSLFIAALQWKTGAKTV
ncbi:uncharacterized protein CC84DRAFT_1169440 [Paraphaeosphaeria sporulosa]|uniref:Uncharacterized protein n=1 Tax=Paraphaeosphaeria sporulosa TaxID=1460663 RepID=A0A177BX77_9PLEO|nr:uncharacterized protein CC84DRAFT_1169440 [Paraphaeosphaeria sporulosa]OAF99301.1 hypothetical protein CC84DRAFT_1169440 [Paraphaeosphaeria sporulosa]